MICVKTSANNRGDFQVFIRSFSDSIYYLDGEIPEQRIIIKEKRENIISDARSYFSCACMHMCILFAHMRYNELYRDEYRAMIREDDDPTISTT